MKEKEFNMEQLLEKEMKLPLQKEKQEAAYLLESGNYLYIQTCETATQIGRASCRERV